MNFRHFLYVFSLEWFSSYVLTIDFYFFPFFLPHSIYPFILYSPFYSEPIFPRNNNRHTLSYLNSHFYFSLSDETQESINVLRITSRTRLFAQPFFPGLSQFPKRRYAEPVRVTPEVKLFLPAITERRPLVQFITLRTRAQVSVLFGRL